MPGRQVCDGALPGFTRGFEEVEWLPRMILMNRRETLLEFQWDVLVHNMCRKWLKFWGNLAVVFLSFWFGFLTVHFWILNLVCEKSKSLHLLLKKLPIPFCGFWAYSHILGYISQTKRICLPKITHRPLLNETSFLYMWVYKYLCIITAVPYWTKVILSLGFYSW